jgi:hypothetical protein
MYLLVVGRSSGSPDLIRIWTWLRRAQRGAVLVGV